MSSRPSRPSGRRSWWSVERGPWSTTPARWSGPPPGAGADAYRKLRRRLGQVILLGLEVLIVGDIVRTIIVSPTVESVAALGLIVLIRIVLSFSLEVEIDGVWPWSAWRLTSTSGDGEPPPSRRSGPPA